MRDTFYALAALAVLVGAYYGFGNRTENLSAGGASPAVSAKRVPFDPSGVKPRAKVLARGNRIREKSKNLEPEKNSEGVGSASDGSELPSLYTSTAPRKSVGGAVEGEKSPLAKLKPAGKSLHGVPVQAWVDHQNNSLSLPPVSAREKEGLRVYLQCVELKKEGPQYLGSHGCETLLAKRGSGQAARAFGAATDTY